ncbi:hypothetical protein AJ80_01844 [Polytolypa hystricis UAMH7299]|uniref:Uncharacterized protein n=1 Tax=Polytolypa hystricis (strain UAMH7299) TaxID=1447883 RepID=A0A2B7YZE9_POLH7|nr:hypothetical protein AJ80_01844 [Polytolypa hystricis UAMH7299]
MDTTVFDDTMEVGSDAGLSRQQNIDDIEIDLDLIGQDQVPDQDVDVDVDDASVTVSDRPGIDEELHQHSRDADMLDGEYQEGEEITLDYVEHQEHIESYETDGLYNRDTYEAEMEDDYEEDIDAPIPGAEVEEEEKEEGEVVESPESGNVAANEKDELQVTELSNETEQIEPVASVPSSVTEQQEPVPDEPLPQEEASHPGEAEREEAGPIETSAWTIDKPANVVEISAIDAGPSTLAAENPLDEGFVGEGQNTEAQEYEDQGDKEAHVRSSPTSGGDVEHVEPDVYEEEEYYEDEEYYDEEAEGPIPLHPIKVLYQDSEISLFPPQAGDQSETFFLENEAIAHHSVYELILACRAVLGEHITSDEEISVDIEPLDLHLLEDTIHSAPITLSQIVEVYLELCHNDGVEEPEPLYLTLSTRRKFLSAFDGLVTAAKAGKGLSEVAQPWEDQTADQTEADGEPVWEPEARELDTESETKQELSQPLEDNVLTTETVYPEEPRPSSQRQSSPSVQPEIPKTEDYVEVSASTDEHAIQNISTPGGDDVGYAHEAVADEMSLAQAHEQRANNIEEPRGASPPVVEHPGEHTTHISHDAPSIETAHRAPDVKSPASSRAASEGAIKPIPQQQDYTQVHEDEDETSHDERALAISGIEGDTHRSVAESAAQGTINTANADLQQGTDYEHIDGDIPEFDVYADDITYNGEQAHNSDRFSVEIDVRTYDFTGDNKVVGPDGEDGTFDRSAAVEDVEAVEEVDEPADISPKHSYTARTPSVHDHSPPADAPGTPEPADSLLDIDEDLFKSPSLSTRDLQFPTSLLPEQQGLMFTPMPEELDIVDVTNDVYKSEPTISHEMEVPNVPIVLPPSTHNSPKPPKRSLVDADINTLDTAAPEIKRQRSE